MAGLGRDAHQRNGHLGGIAKDDLHVDRARTDEMLLRSAERWKAALHPDEENDRQMLLHRNVSGTLKA